MMRKVDAQTRGAPEQWFSEHVGKPFQFQRDTWQAQAEGRSGLLHAPTGMGKTMAAWLGALSRWCETHSHISQNDWSALGTEPLRVLWVTPLRALAADTEQNLKVPIEALGLPWTVQRRTGDTSSSIKKKQRDRLPSCLVTTPESLSVLLSYANAEQKFKSLQLVVVDEWHELMSTKRGTQTELGLARLRAWNPALMTWGLSATLGNLPEAMDTLLGAAAKLAPAPVKIHGEHHKQIAIDTLLPTDVQRFPWAGHLGLHLLDQVIETLQNAHSTLLFTNTRSQAEIWFNAITVTRPEWSDEVALHHGSIDRKERQLVEDRLREGSLRCCVCTSSLDLGVDFSPVEQVIQVASPKGVARLMQRAGRSGHQPGKVSRVVGVPTHALELLDFAAARDATEARAIESRRPLDRPIDVLVQHLVTCAMGGGFTGAAMLREVRSTHAYRSLSDEEWRWALDFVRRGGATLTAYPQYARVIETDGRFTVASQKIARTHRMGIGTITSDAAIAVRYQNGKRLGTVEESFVGYLTPGDRFVFAGHLLQLIRVREMTAYVKQARGKKANVPRWQGGKSPLSTQLSDAVRHRLDRFSRSSIIDKQTPPEVRAIAPLLELQRRWSHIPTCDELLLEQTTTRDGHHWFIFPLRGRQIHEGLATLIAHRLMSRSPLTVSATVNDYGLELLTADPLPLGEDDWRGLLSATDLLDDLLGSLNSSQLARRQFRDIARVAGLILPGFPGEAKSNRHLQASSELFFDVFTDFDPQNLLLDQARREVLERQLEFTLLAEALEGIESIRLRIVVTDRLSPLAFPLWAEHLREQHMSSQTWQDRVSKMVLRLEEAAG